MHDFSQKYRENKVVHFGLWAEEIADQRGDADALRVLQRAAKQTYDDDVRCAEVDDAIAYLSKSHPKRPLTDFRAALDMEDARWRTYAARNALVRIQLSVSRK